jgi:hypothetical protein
MADVLEALDLLRVEVAEIS